MNFVHLHLLLNHLPVIGMPFAGVLLLIGLARKERILVRTAFGFMTAVALATVAVFLTGGPAEDGVENLAGVAERVIDRHEDLATIAFAVTGLAGALALLGLAVSRHGRPVPRAIVYGTAAITVLAIGLLAPTAYLGGQIRHSEIRAAAALAPRSEAAPIRR